MNAKAPEVVILRELLEREPEWVSGTVLAEKLGMSRVAVWGHMEKLREQGFTFEAVRSQGYRLKARPATLHPALVAAHLPARRAGIDLALHDEIDSTNDEAARQLAAGRAAPFVIAARRQTQGRGRRGRAWHSPAEGNLYLSFAFRPGLAPERMQTFTLWMGVNACELIANFTRLAPGLKWPNDILFDGRKAGGMLTEARIDADQIRDLVYGLGLNVNATSGHWPADVAARAVSLADLTHAPLDLNRFAAALLGRVLGAYESFCRGDYLEKFPALWQRYDTLRDRPIAVLHGTQRTAGHAAGIDADGSLLVRTRSGALERFRAGEVTLEK